MLLKAEYHNKFCFKICLRKNPKSTKNLEIVTFFGLNPQQNENYGRTHIYIK